MKSIVINDFCESLGQIRVSDVPSPQPKSDEILIKVAAAGVNFVDILYVCQQSFVLDGASSHDED